MANVYSASKRDCLSVTPLDPQMLTRFTKWYDKIFENEIKPLLENFEYCENAWYNTLNMKQQSRQDKIKMDLLDQRYYCNFCKKEKQEVTDPIKNPKNRCICGPNEEYKYVLGPIVKRLEFIFKRNFPGYTSGKNWEEKEEFYNQMEKEGFTRTIEGDGSGFDRSQYVELKQVEFKIYKYLAEQGYIHHVDPNIFVKQATMETVKIYVGQRVKEGKDTTYQDLGYYEKTGCTQTGNMDTSFANTLRMLMYIRFTMEEILGFDASEYRTMTSGDDFTVFIQDIYESETIKKGFLQVFSSKNQETPHGLGQILKFFKWGGIEDVDFCSTEVFKTKFGYKIIRKLDRFFGMAPYSQQALSMASHEQTAYMKGLAKANLKWMEGMPLLSEYNELYNQFADKIEKETKKGKVFVERKLQKKHKPTNKQHLYECTNKYDEYLQKFGHDEAYVMVTRESNKVGTSDDFYDYLLRRYNLSKTQVKEMIKAFKNMINKKPGQEVYIPYYEDMMEASALYKESLMR